ncbi:MAG: 50S ribosomal protein L21 [Syntrophomonadaceae bacterium]|nr:50S ribosomal protein L21 [Syntrophomonadaceae bacterium]
MYAIITTGGKQYKVSEGSVLKVEKLEAEKGQDIVMDEVLMLKDENGNIRIGNPTVENARVIFKVLDQAKERKIMVYKYKRRKNYRKKQGHRQPYTMLRVEKIEG